MRGSSAGDSLKMSGCPKGEGNIVPKERKRLLERLKRIKPHNRLRTYYGFALDCYAMSRAAGKSRACQHNLGTFAIHPAVGMRFGYGYTFSKFREDIRRRTGFWRLALSKNTPEALKLLKYVDFVEKGETELNDKYGHYSNFKISLKMKGFEGYTIYQPVFPSDIEYKKELRCRPKNRYKGYFKRLRKAERLKKAGKKNWKSFEPKGE